MMEQEWPDVIVDRLSQVACQFERCLAVRLARFGLTPFAARLLGLLLLESHSSQRSLAKRSGCAESHVSLVLDRLETNRLISRSGCSVDRRRNTVSATAECQKLWRQVVAALEDLDQRVCTGMTPIDQRQLIEALTLMHCNLNQRDRRDFETPPDCTTEGKPRTRPVH